MCGLHRSDSIPAPQLAPLAPRPYLHPCRGLLLAPLPAVALLQAWDVPSNTSRRTSHPPNTVALLRTLDGLVGRMERMDSVGSAYSRCDAMGLPATSAGERGAGGADSPNTLWAVFDLNGTLSSLTKVRDAPGG